jgi:hypothetical protein
VRLRGVGATDLTDLVSMRESMFVVQVSGTRLKGCLLAQLRMSLVCAEVRTLQA